MRSSLLALLVASTGIFSQTLSLGVKGGLRTTDDFQYAAISESRRYLVGPTVAVSLPFGFGVGFEALYSRQGYTLNSSTSLYSSYAREADNVWQFPLVGRYQLPIAHVSPFVETGWSPRIAHGFQDFRGSFLSNLNPATYSVSSGRKHADWPTTHGLVVGGGVEIPFGKLRVAPELRYTRWNRPVISGTFADGPSYTTSQNQVDISVGFRWRVRE
jgi:hypothetical protein